MQLESTIEEKFFLKKTKTTRATTEFMLDKDEFYLGETVNVRVIYHGQDCEKALSKITLWLSKATRFKAEWETETDSSTINSQVLEGCKAFESFDRSLQLKIPDLISKQNEIHHVGSQPQDFLKKCFDCSFETKLIKVSYSLRCYVDHEG